MTANGRSNDNVIAQSFHVYLIAGRNLSWMITSHMTNVKVVLLSNIDAEPLVDYSYTFFSLRSSFPSYTLKALPAHIDHAVKVQHRITLGAFVRLES